MAAAIRAIGKANARAAVFGPMLATEISASKNSRSIAFVNPKNVNRPLLPSRLKVGWISSVTRSPSAAGNLSATHAGNTISYASPPTSSSTLDSPRSTIAPEMRENMLGDAQAFEANASGLEIGEREGQRERIRNVVGFGYGRQAQPQHDHPPHLILARGTRTRERAFDVRVPEVPHLNAVFVRRETDYPARVPHEHGGSRVLIRGPKLFDDHHLRRRCRNHVAQLLVQFP